MSDTPRFPESLAESFQPREVLHDGEISTIWSVGADGEDEQLLRVFRHTPDGASQQEVLRHLQGLTELDLPQLPRYREGGTSPDGAWVVMDPVAGDPPTHEGCPVETLTVLREVATALQAIHGAGLLHGDVRTDNVRVDADGQVRLIGACLGVEARKMETDDAPPRTGYPLFMAPQLYFMKRPTPADDWFAYGVMAWHLIEGELPFDASAMGQAAREQTLPRLKPTRVEAKGPLGELLKGLLAFVPQDRSATISRVDELLEAAEDPGRPGAFGAVERGDLPERQTKSTRPKRAAAELDDTQDAPRPEFEDEPETPYGLLASLGALAIAASLAIR